MKQLELHAKIEKFFKLGVDNAVVEATQEFFVNEDGKRFFFSLANENWINWLWKNGFLDEIKSRASDVSQYSYRLPELEYLTRVAEVNPVVVTQIIDSIKISEKNLNPEVIERFIWIINDLPVEQIKILTSKIRDENWVYLMRSFRKSGYEFEKIIKKLAEAKESVALLELAQAILGVKSKTELLEKGSTYSNDDPFYVSDLDSSGIFEALACIEETILDQALNFTTDVMSEIIKLGKPDDENIFEYQDQFALYDVDFFTLEIEDRTSRSYREDVKNLAATIKKLIEKYVSNKSSNIKDVKNVLKYVDKIPSCRSVWRLRLFTLSQCPSVFKDELTFAFFKIFEVGERYFEIEGGAEYHQALLRGFGVLEEEKQREYIKAIIIYFGADLTDKDVEGWRRRDGIQILSLIKNYLTTEELKISSDKFNVLISTVDFKPEPSMSEIRGGVIHHRSPVDVSKFSVGEIIQNLKFLWTEKKFSEQFNDDEDFLNPRGMEGLGDALKEDLKKRTNEYIENIIFFFDRFQIHPHYLYSILRGIEEMLRNKESLTTPQVEKIFNLFDNIKAEGERLEFRREKSDSLVVDWIGVHKVIADIILYILEVSDKEKKLEIHKKHREQIKNIILYLFTIKDSPSKEEEKPEYGEPYSIAINSVRGRAYEVFVVFTENDGKVLAEDTKAIYKQLLSDDSLAVRFVIGRYLATFYFRDKEFISSLFFDIFPKGVESKKNIFFATWEGYLSNTLYDKLLEALRDYYSYAISLEPSEYTERKYLKGLDESLAIHLALAFAHLGLEMGDPLFKQFWAKNNVIRHKEFVSFLGRRCLTNDDGNKSGDDKVNKEKFIKFWDWTLKNINSEEVISEFSYWVNPNLEVLDDNIVMEKILITLIKSKGNLEWEYGLLKRLPFFARKNGQKTFQIIFTYLLTPQKKLNLNRSIPYSYHKEIKESLSIIYRSCSNDLKQNIEDLIDTLILEGSSPFWGLKEVMVE